MKYEPIIMFTDMGVFEKKDSLNAKPEKALFSTSCFKDGNIKITGKIEVDGSSYEIKGVDDKGNITTILK